jgi:hypothetical protein
VVQEWEAWVEWAVWAEWVASKLHSFVTHAYSAVCFTLLTFKVLVVGKSLAQFSLSLTDPRMIK